MRLQVSIRVLFKAWIECGEGRGGVVVTAAAAAVAVDVDVVVGGEVVVAGAGSKAVLKVARREETVWIVGRVGDVKRRVYNRREGGGEMGRENGGSTKGRRVLR